MWKGFERENFVNRSRGSQFFLDELFDVGFSDNNYVFTDLSLLGAGGTQGAGKSFHVLFAFKCKTQVRLHSRAHPLDQRSQRRKTHTGSQT